MNIQVAYSEMEKFVSKKFKKEICISGVGANNTLCMSMDNINARVRVVEIRGCDVIVELGIEVGKMVTSEQATRITVHLKEIEALTKTLDLLVVKGITLGETGIKIEADVLD